MRAGGTLILEGGSISGGSVAAGAAGGAGASAGTASGTGIFLNGVTATWTGSTDGSIADIIAGTGGLTKIGTGTLTLSGANTYTGATTVNAGKLLVNGSLTSAVTVGTSGILGGGGTITGATTVNGRIAPGNSIGSLSVAGTYTQNAGSTYEVEINPNGTSDRIVVTGPAVINGGTVLVQPESGTYAVSTTYTILTATGGVTGTYANVTGDTARFVGIPATFKVRGDQPDRERALITAGVSAALGDGFSLLARYSYESDFDEADVHAATAGLGWES